MNDLVRFLGSTGHELTLWLARANAWTLGLFVAALVVDRLIARRARASWRIALYAPIAGRILLPARFAIGMPHPPRAVTLLTPLPDAALPPPAGGILSGPAFTWEAAVTLVYLAVAAILAFAWWRARRDLRGRLASARPVGSQLDVQTPCPVVVHDTLGPLVAGLVRPRIVIPARLLEGDAQALTFVLRHELAHLARRDAWFLAGMQWLAILAWPVVPLWLAVRRVRDLIELACDDDAVGHASENERHRYGHTLLDMAAWPVDGPGGIGAALHFRIGLRGRIEALASPRRWPRWVQLGLVLAAVISFAACSSVGPETNPRAQAKRAAEASWSPPSGDLWTSADFSHYCRPFLERVQRPRTSTPPDDAVGLWMDTPTEGLPPAQVALCKSPEVTKRVRLRLMAMEGHNAIAQIGKDTATAYLENEQVGRYELCPSGPPVPRDIPAPGKKYQPKWPDDWNAGGWACLRFGMDQPMYFQYELEATATDYTVTARGHLVDGDDVEDVTMVLREHLDETHTLQISPTIEETWTRVR